MRFAVSVSVRPSVHGQIKLARLLGMTEKDFEARVRALEGRELFHRLVELGVVRLEPYPRAAFAARRLAGRELGLEGHRQRKPAMSPLHKPFDGVKSVGTGSFTRRPG